MVLPASPLPQLKTAPRQHVHIYVLCLFLYVKCTVKVNISVNYMFRWEAFCCDTPGGWQIQEHLPLSSTLGAKMTGGTLTLWREQGGNRYDKTSCQEQAQGSQLKCDENIKIVMLSYKSNTDRNVFSVEQVQEFAAVVLVCLLYAGYITVNILLSQFCFCHSSESNG